MNFTIIEELASCKFDLLRILLSKKSMSKDELSALKANLLKLENLYRHANDITSEGYKEVESVKEYINKNRLK